MGKLIVVVTRFLSLCAVLLAIPTIAAAQCISKLTVQRVWTRDAAGTAKNTFAPGETIQFAAELNNSYGGYLLAANGTQVTITTSFYNDTKPVDIPPDISTWPWNATAPSTEGSYTVTVKAYDHFCGTFPEGSASFTVSTATTGQSPRWYYNGAGIIPDVSPIIYEDNSGLRIVWGNSYVYPYPGNVPLYWYAEVVYFNIGNQTLNLTCSGHTDPSMVKEHMRGTANSGYVPADETFCSRNPSFTGSLKPGDTHYSWAIFHNVPWRGGEVSLEWNSFGFSPWVDPWYSSYSPKALPPAECPPELVTLGTCQPAEQPSQGVPPGFVCLGGSPGEQCNQPPELKPRLTKQQLFAILLSEMINYVLAGDLAEQGRRLAYQGICGFTIVYFTAQGRPITPRIADFCRFAQQRAEEPIPTTPAQEAILKRVKQILQEAAQR
jgi:hypothetical protein